MAQEPELTPGHLRGIAHNPHSLQASGKNFHVPCGCPLHARAGRGPGQRSTPSHQRQNRALEATRAPPGCPLPGPGSPASLSLLLYVRRAITPPAPAAQGLLVEAHFLRLLLNHPVCLRSRQMILETTCATYLIRHACKWGSSLDEKFFPCVSASWSARE